MSEAYMHESQHDDDIEHGSQFKQPNDQILRTKTPVAHFSDPSDDLLEDLDVDEPKSRSIVGEKKQSEGVTETLFSFSDSTHFSSLVSTHQIIDALYPLFSAILRSVRKRVKGYIVTVGVLALILVSGGQFKDRQLRGLTSTEWFYLVTLLFALNFCVAIAEDIVFYVFSVLWWGPHDVVYYMDALYGPLGDFVTISIMVNFFDKTKLPNFSINVQDLVTMVMIVIISLIWKRLTVRRHYMNMLEHRLRDRLEAIEHTTDIISTLSSMKNIVDIVNVDETEAGSESHTSDCGKNGGIRNRSRIYPSSSGSGSKAVETAHKVGDFFSEIVQKSKNALDDDADEEEDEEALRHRSFWKRVHSLQSGSLNIMTYSGLVRIRKKKHAVSFGKRLYEHLKQGAMPERGNPAKITTKLLKAALQAYYSDESKMDEDETKAYITKAIQILGCSEENDADECTETNCISALTSLYKEIKFSAKSLDDLQLLHKSVLNIADAVFWVVMFLIAQIVLSVNTLTMLAPLLTILFGVSFAIGPMLSNVFLALSYVIFVIPYDIGNKIVVGESRKTGLYGTVSSITLMYTTIITPLHEKVNIPNHTLFGCRVVNLNESKTATFDMNISFCNDGPYAVSEEQIDEFIDRMRKYFMEDNKKYWQSFDYYCVGLDIPNNTTTYSFWCEHKGAWNETGKVLVGRTYAWRQLRIIQREMGIKFMNLSTSVMFSHELRQEGGRVSGSSGGHDDMTIEAINGVGLSSNPLKAYIK